MNIMMHLWEGIKKSHAIKNQLKVLQYNRPHEPFRENMMYNENFLANATQRMGTKLAKFTQQEDHLLIITSTNNNDNNV